MKKMLLASAFALIGTFAMVNEVEFVDEEYNNRQCTGVKNDCGIALIYCWQGELDPDKLSNFRDKACEDIENEQDAPEIED